MAFDRGCLLNTSQLKTLMAGGTLLKSFSCYTVGETLRHVRPASHSIGGCCLRHFELGGKQGAVFVMFMRSVFAHIQSVICYRY